MSSTLKSRFCHFEILIFLLRAKYNVLQYDNLHIDRLEHSLRLHIFFFKIF
jgi:hypothetical protein